MRIESDISDIKNKNNSEDEDKNQLKDLFKSIYRR